MKIILASNSPRRKELLTMAGIDFEVIPADVEEVTEKIIPGEVVEALSLLKAKAVTNDHSNRVILAADTIVVFDNKILGKPKDEDDAFRMLKTLSGQTHRVYTGVTIIKDNHVNSFHEVTDVTMYSNSDELIKSYIATKDSMDKAGSYGIQGMGAILVKEIKGDFYNVMGLPIARVYRELNF